MNAQLSRYTAGNQAGQGTNSQTGQTGQGQNNGHQGKMISTGGNVNTSNQYSSTNFYNSLTPKSSFDSIGSLHSLGSNVSSVPVGLASNPWVSGSFGSFSIPPPLPPSSGRSENSNSYHDSFNFAPADLSFVNDIDPPNEYSSSPSLNLSNAQKQPFKTLNNKPRGNHNNNSLGNSQFSNASTHQLHLDPVIENEFRNMAKSLEEKEALISDLKLQLESLVTAVAVCGSVNDKAVQEVISEMKMDATEIAHRITIRLKTLKSENEQLGVSNIIIRFTVC
ncbi:Mum2p [Sugiyamaella lignohabitans]|uniref:Mum2p n=1 Tax=Sugiyamaella lignohabitans TaxID=796027 RepID=A0A167ECB6_9ASCO|nr:Mum2p [Sugiyamaella lignohabitans]ANB13899.1 Mum2p [Sugiyamaella lignohabitans]